MNSIQALRIASYVEANADHERTRRIEEFISDPSLPVPALFPDWTGLRNDAYIFYRKAVEEAFGSDVHFAQLTKLYDHGGYIQGSPRQS